MKNSKCTRDFIVFYLNVTNTETRVKCSNLLIFNLCMHAARRKSGFAIYIAHWSEQVFVCFHVLIIRNAKKKKTKLLHVQH